MNSPARVDPVSGIDLDIVAEVLREANLEPASPLEAEVITAGRSNLTYKVSDGTSCWVVRRPPLAGRTPSAHDVAREYTVTHALQNTDVPVARTIASVPADRTGAPFTIVEYVPGQVLRTAADLDPLDDTQVTATHTELIRVMAALHTIDPAAVGLETFGRPEGFVGRQVKRWRGQWDHVATRELPDLLTLHQRLAERIPATAGTGIVHGDYRVDNTLLSPDGARVLAVVDWEMSTLGDPLTDVAMMCAYQHPDFDHVVGEAAASTSTRWPRPDQIGQDYATASGADLGDFDFYQALALFKLAVIAEGIYSRYLAGAGDGPGFATSGHAVPGLVATGLQLLGRAS